MSKPIIRYKTLPEDKTPRGHKYRKGKWYKEKNFRGLCDTGFHCSKNIIDAMQYVTPGWVAKVEVRGESEVDDDKEAWSEIKILEWHKWTKKDSVALAIFAAELVLGIYEKECPNDKRPRDAIEAAKAVLRHDTQKTRADAAKAAKAAWVTADAWAAAKAADAAAAAKAADAAAAAAKAAAAAAAKAAWVTAAAKAAKAAWVTAAAKAADAAAKAAWVTAAAKAADAKAATKAEVINKCHNFVIDRKFSDDN